MELRKTFGVENVGLSTGDMSINRGARIMVMTTEVYRNMAWRASSSKITSSDDNTNYEKGNEEDDNDDNELSNLSVVVLDEFHYMGQPGRGGVWEECVITSPPHTQIIGLSATLPNADDISAWMNGVLTNKRTALVEADGGRPVPLRYMFATRDGLEYLFRDGDAGPGSPKGLLGLRGDGVGVPATRDKAKDKANDSSSNNNNNNMPKGLGLNPKLKTMIQRRSEKINRIIARKSLQAEFKNDYSSNRDNNNNRNRRKTMSVREEQRERERILKSEMRKAVPSLHFLLRKLNQKSLLPAIFFIFSRAGCDSAAESVCYSMRKESNVLTKNYGNDIGSDNGDGDNDNDASLNATKKRRGRKRGDSDRRRRWDEQQKQTTLQDGDGRTFRKNSNYMSEDTMSSILDSSDILSQEELMKELNPLEARNYQDYADRGLLTIDKVREVAARVSAFNKENSEIKFSDGVIDQLLHGVGSHHAGQLPAHKAFVEALFRAQLMKVVFATETLAAGINMPARTTVICSMAKRGDGSSMNMLETSNMLQMAGRAGRRGMDTDGTCVVVSTPFEGPTEAIDILTSEIKPVQSQFSPSYSLAINLISRGEGQLDVAQKLVRKSFAMWGKEQVEERLESVKLAHGEEYEEVIVTAAQVQFLEKLKQSLEERYGEGMKDIPNARVKKVVEVLENKKLLKKASKSFIGLNQILELEENTLRYLQQEAETVKKLDVDIDIDGLQEFMAEDDMNVEREIETQSKRLRSAKEDMSKHVMSAMTIFANDFLGSPREEYNELRGALALSRKNSNTPDEDYQSVNVSPIELCQFSKSAVMTSRKRRKQNSKSKEEGIDESSLIAQLSTAEVGDDSWEDMLALVNVLESYGCIVPSGNHDEIMSEEFKITIAGDNVGALGLDNSLWILVAMGGAWDVKGDSAKLDEFKIAMRDLDSFSDSEGIDIDENNEFSSEMSLSEKSEVPLPQSEAATLVSLLRSLEPSEIAGYVSCLVSDSFRGGNGSALTYFQNLSSTQQRVIQSSLTSLERLMEVQNKYSVDESSSKVQLELGTCEVVTAWAAGCSWNEALEISGLAAGDLVRTLHRALDALRQLGNLSINAARSLDNDIIQTESSGLHPDIRRLCRDAARAMDRYPVKDPLPFDEEDEEEEEEEEKEESISDEAAGADEVAGA